MKWIGSPSLDDEDKEQRDLRLEDMKDDVEDFDFYEEGLDDDGNNP